jgi:hypothetical protein
LWAAFRPVVGEVGINCESSKLFLLLYVNNNNNNNNNDNNNNNNKGCNNNRKKRMKTFWNNSSLSTQKHVYYIPELIKVSVGKERTQMVECVDSATLSKTRGQLQIQT